MPIVAVEMVDTVFDPPQKRVLLAASTVAPNRFSSESTTREFTDIDARPLPAIRRAQATRHVATRFITATDAKN
jgi:hypothetical protein